MGFNKQMLPANVDENVTTDFIPVGNSMLPVTSPVALLVKRPPKLLETVPTSPSGNTEEPKVVSAESFPLLRGFV